MHITSDECFSGGMDFIFGRAILCEKFKLKEADEAVYAFLEGNAKLFFYQNMPQPYADEFIEAAQSMSEGQTTYFMTLLQDHLGVNHLMNLHIRKQSKAFEDGFQYEVDLYDITKVEQGYFTDLQKMDKYRTIMGITNYVYFEYIPEMGKIVCYRYISLKAHALFEGSLEEWHEVMLRYATQDEKNRKAIDLLYRNLLEGKNHIETVFFSGYLNAKHEVEKLELSTEFVGKHHQQMVAGVIRKLDIDEKTVPYYLTKAGVDAATGLLNKRAAIDYSEDILTMAGEEKHYMILIDIDNFKMVNDTYGHDMGDRIIMLVARVLMELLSGRGIVGRFGGDEFYILTDFIHEEMGLRTFIRAANAKLRWVLEKKGYQIPVTLSMGISLYPDNGTDYNKLFALADKALYIGKEKGKNRYIIYRPELHDSIKVIGTGSIGMMKNQDHTRALRIAVNTLLQQGKTALPDILPMIGETFGIDHIAIYTGEKLDKYLEYGEMKDSWERVFFMENKGYCGSFDENHMLRLNEIDEIKGACPEIYAQFAEKKCASMLQLALPTATAPAFLMMFANIERRHKWNENDVNDMNMLGNVIYHVLFRSNVREIS